MPLLKAYRKSVYLYEGKTLSALLKTQKSWLKPSVSHSYKMIIKISLHCYHPTVVEVNVSLPSQDPPISEILKKLTSITFSISPDIPKNYLIIFFQLCIFSICEWFIWIYPLTFPNKSLQSWRIIISGESTDIRNLENLESGWFIYHVKTYP